MKALATSNQRDLPALLETLTIAVTTLDAVGVENYRELYLYVMGTTSNEVVRDLRVEDGHLIVGPPADELSDRAFKDCNLGVDRRAFLLAELGNIMRIWKWSVKATACYLRCSEAMLYTWVARSICTEAPILPQKVIERIKRLSILDQIRFLAGVPDQEMPRWLSSKRTGFSGRSIEDLLHSDNHGSDYIQLVLWSLNGRHKATALN